MNKKEKIIIAGVGVIIAYLFLRQNKGKTLNISRVVISTAEFWC